MKNSKLPQKMKTINLYNADADGVLDFRTLLRYCATKATYGEYDSREEELDMHWSTSAETNIHFHQFVDFYKDRIIIGCVDLISDDPQKVFTLPTDSFTCYGYNYKPNKYNIDEEGFIMIVTFDKYRVTFTQNDTTYGRFFNGFVDKLPNDSYVLNNYKNNPLIELRELRG